MVSRSAPTSKQVGRPTVPQGVRGDPFAQPGLTSASQQAIQMVLPGGGCSGPRRGLATGEQVGLRLAPTPVFPQRFEERGAERHVTAAAPFATIYPNHHPLAIDVADFQTCQFRAALKRLM